MPSAHRPGTILPSREPALTSGLSAFPTKILPQVTLHLIAVRHSCFRVPKPISFAIVLPVDIQQNSPYSPVEFQQVLIFRRRLAISDPRTEVLQGTLDLMILKTLDSMGALHGYGIARRIEQLSNDLLRMNQGTLYPAVLRSGAAGLD